MKNSNLRYCLKTGLSGLHKNPAYAFASILMLSICLFLFGTFLAIFENVKPVTAGTDENSEIMVFLEEGTDASRIMGIRDEIGVLEDVKGVSHVSGEEAWRKYKASLEIRGVPGTIESCNPYAGLEALIVYESENANLKKLTERIGRIQGVGKMRYPEEFCENVLRIERIAKIIIGVILIILISVSLFLVSLTISADANMRRDEIRVMVLVGASDRLIMLPFAVEGFFIGLIGSVIPITFVIMAYAFVGKEMIRDFGDVLGIVSTVPQIDIIKIFVPMVVVFGIGMSLLVGWTTAGHKLRRVRSELI